MNTPGWEVIKTTRRTGNGLMEVCGLNMIIGDLESLAMEPVDLRIILVLTFMAQECGMTSVSRYN